MTVSLLPLQPLDKACQNYCYYYSFILFFTFQNFDLVKCGTWFQCIGRWDRSEIFETVTHNSRHLVTLIPACDFAPPSRRVFFFFFIPDTFFLTTTLSVCHYLENWHINCVVSVQNVWGTTTFHHTRVCWEFEVNHTFQIKALFTLLECCSSWSLANPTAPRHQMFLSWVAARCTTDRVNCCNPPGMQTGAPLIKGCRRSELLYLHTSACFFCYPSLTNFLSIPEEEEICPVKKQQHLYLFKENRRGWCGDTNVFMNEMLLKGEVQTKGWADERRGQPLWETCSQ